MSRSLDNATLAFRRSAALAARILVPEPTYQGTMFHVTVRVWSIPACWLSKKKFFAVSSGLLREMNPDVTAFGPGASKRNRHSALIPPSRGSSRNAVLRPELFAKRHDQVI